MALIPFVSGACLCLVLSAVLVLMCLFAEEEKKPYMTVYVTSPSHVTPKEIQELWKRNDPFLDGAKVHYYNEEAMLAAVQEISTLLEKESDIHGAENAFHNLRPGAFKADLWRVMMLWAKGGIYLDCDLELQVPIRALLSHSNSTLFLVQDCVHLQGKNGLAWAYWNAMMAASTPRHKIVEHMIRTMVDNIHAHYYGEDQPDYQDLAITGPRALGMALESYVGSTKDLSQAAHVEKSEFDVDPTVQLDGQTIVKHLRMEVGYNTTSAHYSHLHRLHLVYCDEGDLPCTPLTQHYLAREHARLLSDPTALLPAVSAAATVAPLTPAATIAPPTVAPLTPDPALTAAASSAQPSPPDWAIFNRSLSAEPAKIFELQHGLEAAINVPIDLHVFGDHSDLRGLDRFLVQSADEVCGASGTSANNALNALGDQMIAAGEFQVLDGQGFTSGIALDLDYNLNFVLRVTGSPLVDQTRSILEINASTIEGCDIPYCTTTCEPYRYCLDPGQFNRDCANAPSDCLQRCGGCPSDNAYPLVVSIEAYHDQQQTQLTMEVGILGGCSSDRTDRADCRRGCGGIQIGSMVFLEIRFIDREVSLWENSPSGFIRRCAIASGDGRYYLRGALAYLTSPGKLPADATVWNLSYTAAVSRPVTLLTPYTLVASANGGNMTIPGLRLRKKLDQYRVCACTSEKYEIYSINLAPQAAPTSTSTTTTTTSGITRRLSASSSPVDIVGGWKYEIVNNTENGFTLQKWNFGYAVTWKRTAGATSFSVYAYPDTTATSGENITTSTTTTQVAGRRLSALINEDDMLEKAITSSFSDRRMGVFDEAADSGVADAPPRQASIDLSSLQALWQTQKDLGHITFTMHSTDLACNTALGLAYWDGSNAESPRNCLTVQHNARGNIYGMIQCDEDAQGMSVSWYSDANCTARLGTGWHFDMANSTILFNGGCAYSDNRQEYGMISNVRWGDPCALAVADGNSTFARLTHGQSLAQYDNIVVYTNTGENLGSKRLREIENFQELPTVEGLSFQNQARSAGYAKGTLSWSHPGDMTGVEHYNIWLSQDQWGYARVSQIVEKLPATVNSYSVDAVTDGAEHIIVYTCNQAGEQSVGASVPVGAFQDEYGVSIFAGLKYSATDLTYSATGRTRRAWNLQCAVTWQHINDTSDTTSSYSVYSSPDGQFETRRLLAELPAGTSELHLPPDFNFGNDTYVGVFTDEDSKVGQVRIKNINHYKRMPQVTDIRWEDLDLRRDWLGGYLNWSEPSDARGLSHYNIWLSEDLLGFKRVRQLNYARLPIGRNFYQLRNSGVPTANARYILVYSANLAGEQSLAAGVALVDRYETNTCRNLTDFLVDIGTFAHRTTTTTSTITGTTSSTLATSTSSTTTTTTTTLATSTSTTTTTKGVPMLLLNDVYYSFSNLLSGQTFSVSISDPPGYADHIRTFKMREGSTSITCPGDIAVPLVQEPWTPTVGDRKLTWSSYAWPRPDSFHVCLCDSSRSNCLLEQGYDVTMGTIGISGPSHLETTDANGNPIELGITVPVTPGTKPTFSLRLYGQGMTVHDRILVVDRIQYCGSTVANLVSGASAPSQDQVGSVPTMRWANLVLSSSALQSYRVCWCSGSSANVCDDAKDYVAQPGIFAVGGWGLSLAKATSALTVCYEDDDCLLNYTSLAFRTCSQIKRFGICTNQGSAENQLAAQCCQKSCGLCGSRNVTTPPPSDSPLPSDFGTLSVAIGELFTLELQGASLLISDRLRVVPDKFSCGSMADGHQHVEHVRGRYCDEKALDAPSDFLAYPGAKWYDRLRWENLKIQAQGRYRVCYCGLESSACQDPSAFPIEAGYINVASVDRVTAVSGISGQTPFERDPFSVVVHGAFFSEQNRLRLMQPGLLCGDPGSLENWMLWSFQDTVNITSDALMVHNVVALTGTYRVCWCSGDGRGTGCQVAEDFAVTVGSFQVSQLNFNVLELSVTNGMVGGGKLAGLLGQPLSLQVVGRYMYASDTIYITRSTLECGNTSAAIYFNSSHTTLGITTTDGRSTLTWPGLEMPTPGVFKVCFCGTFLTPHCRNWDTHVLAGSFVVSTVTGITTNPRPRQFEPFDLTVLGSHLTVHDRIMVVDSSGVCGSSASVITLPANIGSALPGEGIVWSGLTTIMGDYQVCLCMGLGSLCLTEHFSISVGTFTVVTELEESDLQLQVRNGVVGAAPLVVATGQRFSLQVVGKHLSVDDRVRIVRSALGCSSTEAYMSSEDVSRCSRNNQNCKAYYLDRRAPQFQDLDGSMSLTWTGVQIILGGEYSVCYCHALIGNCNVGAPKFTAGTLTVASVHGIQVHSPKEFQAFNLTLLGTPFTAGDRIRIVNDTMACGTQPLSNSVDVVAPPIGSGFLDNVGISWNDLAADVGRYRVCWCGGLGDACTDFDVLLGEFEVAYAPEPTQRAGIQNIVNGLTGLGPLHTAVGLPFDLKLVGDNLFTTDRIQIIDASMTCGAGQITTRIKRACYQNDACYGMKGPWLGGQPDQARSSRDSLLFPHLTATGSGVFRVCLCGVIAPRCAANGFIADIGTFQVTTFDSVEVQIVNSAPVSGLIPSRRLQTRSTSPVERESFLLEIRGSRLSTKDRIQLVKNANCGETGEAVTIKNFKPEVAPPEGMIWEDLAAPAGSYSICWCGGLGARCNQSQYFNIALGQLQVTLLPGKKHFGEAVTTGPSVMSGCFISDANFVQPGAVPIDGFVWSGACPLTLSQDGLSATISSPPAGTVSDVCLIEMNGPFVLKSREFDLQAQDMFSILGGDECPTSSVCRYTTTGPAGWFLSPRYMVRFAALGAVTGSRWQLDFYTNMALTRKSCANDKQTHMRPWHVPHGLVGASVRCCSAASAPAAEPTSALGCSKQFYYLPQVFEHLTLEYTNRQSNSEVHYTLGLGTNITMSTDNTNATLGSFMYADDGAQYYGSGSLCALNNVPRMATVGFACDSDGSGDRVVSVVVDDLGCYHHFTVALANLCCSSCQQSPGSLNQELTFQDNNGGVYMLTPGLSLRPESGIIPELFFDHSATANDKDNQVYSEITSPDAPTGTCVVSGAASFYSALVTFSCGATDDLISMVADSLDPCKLIVSVTYRSYCCRGTLQPDPASHTQCSAPSGLRSVSEEVTFQEAEQLCANDGLQLCSTTQLDSGVCCNEGPGAQAVRVWAPIQLTATMLDFGCSDGEVHGIAVNSISWVATANYVSSFRITYRQRGDSTILDSATYSVNSQASGAASTGSMSFVKDEFITDFSYTVGCSSQGIACGITFKTSINRTSPLIGASVASGASSFRTEAFQSVTGLVLTAGQLAAVITTPICEVLVCPSPPVLRDAYARYSCAPADGIAFRTGEQCSILCAVGYESEAGRMECQYGSWIAHDPLFCTPLPSCPTPPGWNEPAKIWSLVKTGDPWVDDQHLASGAIWDVTCKLPLVSSDSNNQVVTYVCRDGTFQIRVPERAGLDLITWQGPLTCVDQTCPMSTATFWSDRAGGFTGISGESQMGLQVSLDCAGGYELIPNLYLACVYLSAEQDLAIFQSQGIDTASRILVTNWQDSPASAKAKFVPVLPASGLIAYGIDFRCERVDCTAPNYEGVPVFSSVDNFTLHPATGTPDPTMLRFECKGLKFGDTCAPVCRYGYYVDRANGAGALTCQADRTFTGVARCLIFVCGAAPQVVLPATLELGCAGRVHGSTCSIICPNEQFNDFDYVGDTQFTCVLGNYVRNDGGNPHAQCTEKACPFPPKMPWGEDNLDCAGLAHGVECPTTCSYDYQLQGPAPVCQAGTFRLAGACAYIPAAEDDEVVELQTTSAIQASVNVDFNPANLSLEEIPPEKVLNYDWAVEHRQLIAKTCGKVMEVEAHMIIVELWRLLPDGTTFNPGWDDIPIVTTTNAPSVQSGSVPAVSEEEPQSGVIPAIGGRRLQNNSAQGALAQEALYSSNAFQLRLVLLVPSDTEEEEVEEKVQRLFNWQRSPADPASVAAGTEDGSPPTVVSDTPFMNQFKVVLAEDVKAQCEEEGVLPAPTVLPDRCQPPVGLEDATVQTIGHPIVYENFVSPVYHWYKSGWLGCDAICGDGREERKVICRNGGVCAEEKPDAFKPCVSYDGCPFELLCPLGKGTEPDCETQKSIVLGSIGSIIGCCILCIMRWIQVKLRPNYEGERYLRELKTKAKYHIKRPQHGVIPGGGDDEAERSRNKVHVIWDVDNAQLESFLKRRPSLAHPAGAGTGLRDLRGAGRSPGRGEIEDSTPDAFDDFTIDVGDDSPPEEVRISAGVDTRPGHEVFESFFAYQDGSRVEYYSLSHRRWMAGSVQVETKANNKPRMPPVIFYHVKISRGQVRHHVELELLRKPFERGELVELFSRRNGGTWLPASINGPQDSGATTFGYRVRLNSDGQIYEEIPPIRLRRRFPRCLPIEVYRGFEAGWVPTTVHHSSTEDGCGLEEIDHKDIRHSIAGYQVDSGIEVADQDHHLQAIQSLYPHEDTELAGIVPIPETNRQGPELNIDIWTRVPICIDDEGDFFEVVDSYLIRQRFDEREHERQENRRQVAL